MPENTKNEDKSPTTEAQQDVAKATGAKAEATSDELSMDDLEAVAGGRINISNSGEPPRASVWRPAGGGGE